MPSELTNEEKRQLSNERQNAVRRAWKLEGERVKNGKGTRDWTSTQQKEILDRGSVRGYEGHHMKSVSLYPEYAGEPRNIQFLTEEEHLYGAHNGDYHNLTNGYYDPELKQMIDFNGDELKEIPELELSNNKNSEIQTIIVDEYNNTDNDISNITDYENSQSNEYEV